MTAGCSRIKPECHNDTLIQLTQCHAVPRRYIRPQIKDMTSPFSKYSVNGTTEVSHNVTVVIKQLRACNRSVCNDRSWINYININTRGIIQYGLSKTKTNAASALSDCRADFGKFDIDVNILWLDGVQNGSHLPWSSNVNWGRSGPVAWQSLTFWRIMGRRSVRVLKG